MEHYMTALVRAMDTALATGAEPWDKRVYKDFLPPSPEGEVIRRPYVVCNLVAAQLDGHPVKMAKVVWQVKAVANDQATAYMCHSRLTAILDGADHETAKQLSAGDDWVIGSVKEDTAIDFSELIAGMNSRIYHAGARYLIFMNEVI